MVRHTTAAVLCALATGSSHGQALFDTNLAVDLVAEGLGSTWSTLTTAIVFVDDDTLLAVNRGDGHVYRVDLQPGCVVNPGPVVFDLDVIVAGVDSQSEYGVQAMELHPNFATNGYVYIRYDQSLTPGIDTPQEDVIDGPNFSASAPSPNMIERYVWDPAANGGLGSISFDTVIHTVTVDTRYHHGGPIIFHADGTLSTIYGDLRRTSSAGWMASTAGPLLSGNTGSGVVEDHATVIRLQDDGSIPTDNPFDTAHPDVPAGAETWYAYGIRNSFGLAIDPATGDLWDTENGHATFDEINRIPAGFNSGWKQIMGPLDHPAQTGTLDNLVELPGSTYGEPEFSWYDTIGVTGMHFLCGSALGAGYDDTLLVGCVNEGHLWGFRLNEQRDGFLFNTPLLQDRVDDTTNPLGDPAGAENEEIVLGVGFGGLFSGIIAIERGADGWPYLLTAQGKLYRIRLAQCDADVNADGVINVLDLIDLLLCFGQPAVPGCESEDINLDGTVNVLDLIDLLLAFGTACP